MDFVRQFLKSSVI